MFAFNFGVGNLNGFVWNWKKKLWAMWDELEFSIKWLKLNIPI